MTSNEPKKALILMSHTGGGHRSVAKAIEKGLMAIGGGEIEPRVVDLFAVGKHNFLDHVIHLYAPIVVHSPSAWALVYHTANGRRRFAALVRLAEPLVRRRIEKLLTVHSPHVVISVHPLSNHVITRTISRLGLKAPVVTVLTDLVDVHAGWVSLDSDLCVAPTVVAAEALRAKGVRSERVVTLGLPIGPGFGAVEEETGQIRVSLGIDSRKFTVLVAGGSEGAGGIYRVVKAIADSGLDAQLLVVCGNNDGLRRRLDESRLVTSGRVYGYVDNMPELMHAADVVATKAGSLSVAEALSARRPLVIFKALPGQEQGNIGLVRHSEVGFSVSRPEHVAGILKRMAADSDLCRRLAANTAKVRKPEAAIEVARAIARLIGVSERAECIRRASAVGGSVARET